MGTIRDKTVLSELDVRETMRRQLVTLSEQAPLEHGIRTMVKYKVSGLLVTDSDFAPAGVLTKTDIMGAYYAGLPVDSPAADVMVSPPLYCLEDQRLDAVLEIMRESRVYRLYVRDAHGQVTGVIAYPDIVGMLYSFCRECPQSRWQSAKRQGAAAEPPRFKVREIMSPSVMSFSVEDDLMTVMEGLSANRIGAVLLKDGDGLPAGVVSKSDLILAYRRGMDPGGNAGEIMSTPVRHIDQEECLETALQQLIFTQLHRLFVCSGTVENIVGVLSLSDAARMRSGSCHACIMSRIKVEEEQP